MAFPLTDEQRKIVDDRGGELLVSAAAGSGKTRVLVERLLDRVTEDRVDIDRFLVITYTKAAAAELRARIGEELSKRLAETPHDRHLRRQSTLLYKAQISTIHSFCSALLRESGHLLDLDPDFRLCDEGEGAVLMAQVLEELLNRRYEDMDGDFSQLVDTMSAGRDDSRLQNIVLDVFGRIQSHANPDVWLEEQELLWGRLDTVGGAEETPWGALLLDYAGRQSEYCLSQLIRARKLAGDDEMLELNYGPTLDQAIEDLEQLRLATRHSWDKTRGLLPVTYLEAGRKRKRATEASPFQLELAKVSGDRLKAIRANCKKRLDELDTLMDGDSAAVLGDMLSVRPGVIALLKLVKQFGADYDKEKARRRVLDFSDLEHKAVQLLWDWQTGTETELAHRWSTRFEQVMVDEYQDTNQVQNAIFSAISDKGRTLFLVGDVKQSIYRFRLADPTIFLEKYRRFPDGDEAQEGEPRRRVLSRNFRSRPEVLEGCNDLFRNIMSTEFGELDYTDDQALVPGAEFPPSEDCQLELAALDLTCIGEMEGEKENKDLLEARYAAKRIQELLGKPFLVRTKEGQRPVVPSDIMILLRSPGPVLHHYIRALNERGIPWAADGGEDFFQSTEVNVALSILQIVDNPRQDVALIAALRSPVYGFTGDELAMLRGGRGGDFYTAVVQAGEDGNQKCLTFLKELEELRFGMGDKTCRQLIWHIYEQTNLLGLFGAMDGGGERQGNLLTLYNLAGQMEDGGCRSLFQFLLRLERQRATGRRIQTHTTSQGGGVTIMSIHRSKGLECPVVLVCGLAREFNKQNWQQPVLFHPEYGVGPKGLDLERMLEYPTLARQGVTLQLKRESKAEELRLLYVAMTRAQEKLILTMGLTSGLKTIGGMGDDLSVPVDPMALERQSCVGNWVLLHALTRPEGDFLRQEAGLPQVVAENLGPAWDFRWVDGTPLLDAPEQPGRFVDLTEDSKSYETLAEDLSWSYSHVGAVKMPSKLTATQLRKEAIQPALEPREELPTAAAEETWLDTSIKRPQFVSEQQGLTPAQRGTALHMAMQYLPIKGDHSVATIQKELARLVAEGYLTQLQGEAIKAEKLAAFYQSPLGQAAQRAKTCQQEFKFSVLLPAEDYGEDVSGEQVLLQGVIDCWFEDEGEITVLDFKSDRIRPGQEEARGEEYRPQLTAYAKALEVILGRPVKRKMLWFFATNTKWELA